MGCGAVPPFLDLLDILVYCSYLYLSWHDAAARCRFKVCFVCVILDHVLRKFTVRPLVAPYHSCCVRCCSLVFSPFRFPFLFFPFPFLLSVRIVLVYALFLTHVSSPPLPFFTFPFLFRYSPHLFGFCAPCVILTHSSVARFLALASSPDDYMFQVSKELIRVSPLWVGETLLPASWLKVLFSGRLACLEVFQVFSSSATVTPESKSFYFALG